MNYIPLNVNPPDHFEYPVVHYSEGNEKRVDAAASAVIAIQGIATPSLFESGRKLSQKSHDSILMNKDDFVQAYQREMEELKSACDFFMGKYGAHIDQSLLTSILPRIFSWQSVPFEGIAQEDCHRFSRLREVYVHMSEVAQCFKEFKEQKGIVILPEASFEDYREKIEKLETLFQVEAGLVPQTRHSGLVEALSSITETFSKTIGSAVYMHIPRSNPDRLYYSPRVSYGEIVRVLKNAGCFAYPTSPDWAASSPTYEGFGVNPRFCAFGRHCTLVTLFKTDEQKNEQLKKLGVLVEKTWMQRLTNGLREKEIVDATSLKQDFAMTDFKRDHVPLLLLRGNYAAVHIPSQDQLINDYRLSKEVVVSADFIVLFHREVGKSLEQIGEEEPFKSFSKLGEFWMQVSDLDMSLEELEKKIQQLTIESARAECSSATNEEKSIGLELKKYETIKAFRKWQNSETTSRLLVENSAPVIEEIEEAGASSGFLMQPSVPLFGEFDYAH